jgi:hypothetical protein
MQRFWLSAGFKPPPSHCGRSTHGPGDDASGVISRKYFWEVVGCRRGRDRRFKTAGFGRLTSIGNSPNGICLVDHPPHI